MRRAVRRLQRGTSSIRECEAELDALIVGQTSSIEDIDERIEAERKLRRKAWRMLLEVTKGPSRSR